MAKTYLKPKLIFDRCVDFLIQKRIQVPSARTLSDLIRAGLQEHKTELIALMGTHLTDKTRHLLDDLFTTPGQPKPVSVTEAIFGITHLLGFSFAPRIKRLNRQTLYLFRSTQEDRSVGLGNRPQTKYINAH